MPGCRCFFHRDITLPAFERLGDNRSAAATWDLAQIDLARREYQAAFPRLVESFQIMRHLQRADGIATIGVTLGELLIAADHTDDGRQVLGESVAAAATKIGNTGLAAEINQLLNPPDEETTTA